MNARVELRKPFTASLLAGAALVLGTAFMVSQGGGSEQGKVVPWLGGFAVITLVWLASLRLGRIPIGTLIVVAVAIRGIFLLMPPGSDIHRYLWEGRVLLAGSNPYLHPPDDPALGHLRDESWGSVGHPGVSAIYPPLAQWFFALLVGMGGGLLTFKAVFAGVDLLVCLLLLRRFGPKASALYAWNPLAAYSSAGGGHYDSLFIAACVAGWLEWRRGEAIPWQVSLWFGAAIALKWMALPVALWIVIQEWRRSRLAAARTMGALAFPVAISWSALSQWTGEWTLKLAPADFTGVARSAELIPGLVRGVTGDLFWHNGWFLAAMFAGWIAVARRASTLPRTAELGFHIAYLLSPMIHAWYFTWALAFAPGTRNRASIALTATGIAYFFVHHTQQLTGEWAFPWWLRAVIWGPFLFFVVADARRMNGRGISHSGGLRLPIE